MEVFKNIFLFIKNIFTIVKTWLVEFFSKHLFKNIVLLGATVVLWYLGGSFFTFLGWAAFWIWVGSNLEIFGQIFKELKEKNKW